nr:Chain C, ACE-SER-SER-THR-GLY-SER-ILE-ASP-MET-VAL-ASP [Homo sapiens]8FYU_E Chain E, ACE-SER-SER-THR-GLY-SER-ILE-ASP-MET-VAL-ASP [Homo sapiens]
SSTGSIDMVD